jgi:phage minor structural protein
LGGDDLKPILYNATETVFDSYGLGEMSANKATVTRERNGNYSLYIEYPVGGSLTPLFKQDMRIKSDAGVRTKNQTFYISRIVKDSSHVIKIYAKHISHLTETMGIVHGTTVVGDANVALARWSGSLVGGVEFRTWSDIETEGKASWTVDKFKTAREALGGVEGSILDVWGGEYEFDNTTIRLHKQLGRKTPTVLQYGRNILSAEEDENSESSYTSIYPYASYTPEADEGGRQADPVFVTLPEKIVDSQWVKMYADRRVQIVDFSSKFAEKETPTLDKLRKMAERYVHDNRIGIPKTSIKVEYVDLAKTLDYADMAFMEEVELCDIVPIFYPKIGLTNEDGKVVVVNYDVLNDRNESIEIGTIGQGMKSAMVGSLGERLETLENRQIRLESNIPAYLLDGKGNKVWYQTPDNTREHKVGDTWFEKNGLYDRIYVWNGEMWEKRIDTEDVDKVKKEVNRQFEEVKVTIDRAISEVNERSSEALKKAGASEDLAKEAKQIGLDSVAKLEEFKRQATNAQTALSGDLDVFKRTVNNEINQASEYRRTTTEALSRMTGQINGFATKSEVKQDIDGLTQTFAKMKVGGRNLLKGSKGPFMPDIKPANFDNNILYVENTSIYMEQGQEYIISAKTDGNFTNNHDWSKESDNVVLWIMGKKLRPYQIVSDLNTGTTGTKFIWNKPTGIYHLRVNTYHKEATKSVWDVKIEKGNVPTDWSPAIEDTDGLITEAKATFEQTAQGLRTDLSAIQEYVNKDGQRQEVLQRYTREESARQATAVRELVTRDYVGKATYQEDVRGINQKIEAVKTTANKEIATQIANYRQSIDGKFTDISSQVTTYKQVTDEKFGDLSNQIVNNKNSTDDQIENVRNQLAKKVELTDFQHVKETSQLYERILGTSETGAPDKLSRLVMSSEIFQTEVGKYSTQGGPNMLRNSRADDGLKYWTEANNRLGFTSHDFYFNGQKRMFELRPGAVVKSPRFIVKRSADYTLNILGFDNNSKYFRVYFCKRKKGSSEDFEEKQLVFVGRPQWTNGPVFSNEKTVKKSFKFNIGDYDEGYLQFEYDRNNPNKWGGLFMTELDFYEGSNDRLWQPAPEDSAEPIEATRTQVAQLAGSYAIKNLNSAGDLISGINLGANGYNRFDGKLTHITGETLIDNAVIKDGMIANLNANKITGGTIDASEVNIINVNASNILAGTLTGMKIRGGQIDSINGNMHINLQTNQFIFNGRASIEFKSPNNSLEFNSGGRKAFLAPTVSQGTNYAAFAFGVNDRGDHDPNRDFVGLKIFNQPDARQVVIIGDLILTSYANQGIQTTSLKDLFELINDNFKRLREYRVQNGEGSPGFWDITLY